MMTRRARLTLALVGILLVLAAAILLAYALLPSPLENLQATLVPTLLMPPQGAP